MGCRSKTRAVVLAFAILIFTPMAQAASSLVSEGMEHFKAKRFYAAEDCFNRAVGEDPQNQTARFLLGQTLEQLYDDKAAKLAFTDCYRLNPFNEQGKMAKAALLALSGRVEGKAHEATDTPNTVAHTIAIIQRQSSELSGNYIKRGNDQASWAIGNGNRESARLGYDQQMTLNSLYRGRRNYGQYDEISQRYQIRSSWARSDAQVQALKHATQATIAARELTNSAANLEVLLAEKKRPGEAKLRALGTQLYVRYYGTEDHEPPTPPEDPPIELKASEQKLSNLPPVKKLAESAESTEPVSLSQALGAALNSKHY